MNRFLFLSGLASFLWLPSVAAQDRAISLARPLDCVPGQNCWIVNYTDADAARDSAKDFRCGARTYDGHDGVDIALADRVSMETGVAVLAAAEGKVLRVRDGMEDKDPDKDEIAQMLAESKGCGNGVFIEHEGGWQTIYCHLKKDSITVKSGAAVKAGDKIGLAGQSGAAEMPHVHLGVIKDGILYDPFTGRKSDAGCGGADNAPLWAEDSQMIYEPVAFFGGGFHDAAPDFEAIEIDAAPVKKITADSRVLTFWTGFFGAVAGDKIVMEIKTPAGEVFARRDIIQDKTRARQFYYIGRKLKDGETLVDGEWTGGVQLVRTNEAGQKIEKTFSAAVSVSR